MTLISNTYFAKPEKIFQNFSNCTDAQSMYHELSLKIMDTAFERAKQLAKALFPKCESYNAWEASDSIQFAQCTEEIGLSNLRIHSSMSDIEVFVANNLNSTMKIQNQLGQIMEDVDLNPSLSDGLDIALIFFKKGASFFTNVELCSQIADCRKTVREVWCN